MGGMEAEKRDARPVTVRMENGDFMLRLDRAWRIPGLNQDLIRAADQKIYLLIVMSTLFPRRQSDAHETEKLIFFGDIASRPNAEDYIRHIRAVPLEQLFEDLTRQIYQVSQIATGKYLAYRRAWRAMLTEVGLFVLLEFSMVI